MKLNQRIFLPAFFIISCLLVFSGCYKKDFNGLTLADAQPEYLYPLIDAELNLKNIVDANKKQLNILENSEGYYTFIYYLDVLEQYITDYLRISDHTINQSVSLNAGETAALPVSGSVSHAFSNSFMLSTSSGEQLRTINVKSGSIPLTVSSSFKHTIELTIVFPFIKKNNIGLTKVITIPSNGSAFFEQIDLSGYIIDLTKGNTTVNTISYNASLKVTYVAGNPVSTTQKIDINTGLKDIQYSYADGYIGQYVLAVPESTLTIDIFNNAYAGNVFFTDPKVRTIIYNSIGVPVNAKINSLTTVSNISGNTPITGSIINTDIAVNYPASINELGKTITLQLDKGNSNVQTVFNPAPDQVAYEVTATINKEGNTGAMNFVTDTSKIKVRGEVEIPMEGRVTKLVLLDTIKGITYPDVSTGNDITIMKAGFIINIENGFPLDAMLQLYFLDDANKVIDSLFSQGPQLILAGSTDMNGKVERSVNTLIKEMVEEQRYKEITTSSQAAMYIVFRTANNGTIPVRIYPTYKVKSNIAIDVKTNVSF